MLHLHKQLHIQFPIGGSDWNVASIRNQISGGHLAKALILNLHAAAKYILYVSFELQTRGSISIGNIKQDLIWLPGANISNLVREQMLSVPNRPYPP
jgi:hypothetical protein